jgi:hypothetical protein
MHKVVVIMILCVILQTCIWHFQSETSTKQTVRRVGYIITTSVWLSLWLWSCLSSPIFCTQHPGLCSHIWQRNFYSRYMSIILWVLYYGKSCCNINFVFRLCLQLRSSERRQPLEPLSDRQRRLMECPLRLIKPELVVKSPVQCAPYSSAEFLLLLATQSLNFHFAIFLMICIPMAHTLYSFWCHAVYRPP